MKSSSLSRSIFFFVIAAILLCLSTFSTELWAQSKKSFTLVLDPGHGGGDSGAVGNGAVEKKINLAVALEVRRQIREKYPEINVLMTRSTDVFIGLRERAQFANRKKADLFISIHANSAGKAGRAKGTETYVLGLNRAQDNLRAAMRENESILLEKDYSVKYQGFDPSSTESYIIFETMQNVHLKESIKVASEIQKAFVAIHRADRSVRQDVFLVLRETTMPSVLVETGFVSNKEEAEYLKSEVGCKAIASAIVSGFSNYYRAFSGKKDASVAPRQTTKTSEEKITEPEQPSCKASTQTDSAPEKNYYRIQIATSTQKKNLKDSFFAGLKDLQTEQVGSKYFYTVEGGSSLREARQTIKELKKRFPDCFIVEYENGNRKRSIY